MLHQELPCSICIYKFDMYDNHEHIKQIWDPYIYIFTVNINIFARKDSIIYKPIVSYSLLISLIDLYCRISCLFLARYFAWNSKCQFFGSYKFGQGLYKAMNKFPNIPCISIFGIFTYTYLYIWLGCYMFPLHLKHEQTCMYKSDNSICIYTYI